MRRAYVEVHLPLRESFGAARAWAGDTSVTLLVASTRDVEDAPWLAQAGLAIATTSNRHTRFTARPRGTVIAWCLDLAEILEVESCAEVDGVVAIRAHDGHAPWITAHQVECLGGQPVAPVPEAEDAIQVTVEGITQIAVLNQGLIDRRERHMAIQALTYLRSKGYALDRHQLTTEAIRRGWPRTSPLDLASIAEDLNAGRRLRFERRLNDEALAEWAGSGPAGDRTYTDPRW